MYFSTLCSLRSFAVDFFARGLHTRNTLALTLALARLSCCFRCHPCSTIIGPAYVFSLRISNRCLRYSSPYLSLQRINFFLFFWSVSSCNHSTEPLYVAGFFLVIIITSFNDPPSPSCLHFSLLSIKPKTRLSRKPFPPWTFE